MTLTYIQSLFQYNHDLNEQMWQSVGQVTAEQFGEEIDYSRGSLHKQLLHMANTEVRWLWGLQEKPEAREVYFKPVDYPTRELTYDLWLKSSQAFLDYVAALDPEQLAHTPKGMPGQVWQVLFHVVNHGTDHRAQILQTLHHFGASTFDQDLIMYLWRPRD